LSSNPSTAKKKKKKYKKVEQVFSGGGTSGRGRAKERVKEGKNDG
jgi:hypothetical protein